MGKIEAAVVWMEKTAKDSSHGYDQIFRWGEKGDYDCSGAVITALKKSGIDLKKSGATYTGNIRPAALKNGFEDVTSTINLKTGKGLKRGDILLKEFHHVAMYCGNGMEVEASINEKGTATGGKPGDQTGREFLIRSYRNYPWNCVLRYVDDVPKKQSKHYGKYKCKAFLLNVRADAGTKSKITGVIKKGAVVTSDGTYKTVNGQTWVKVYTAKGSPTGYVSLKYLEKVKA